MKPIDRILLGTTLHYSADPFGDAGIEAAQLQTDSAVLVRDNLIHAVGPAEKLRKDYPRAVVHDYGSKLIMAGFVDAHVHYPQTGIIASWGKRLIDWLNSYTFPEEMRFGDAQYAEDIASLYFDLAMAHGTTSMASFCTIHPESVEAFFSQALARGLRVAGGKTCMDRNAPEGLRDTSQSAYDDSKALLSKWHGQGRLSYAITPRFTPTSTPEQLEAMGALWQEHPSCLMQTHLSEQVEEIAWVKDLHPEPQDYLATYERVGLIGKGALMGHSIHLTPRERARMAETGTGVVHCPTSNTFIGSGLCDVAGLKALGVPVGLGTDTGGGSSFSMLRTMAAAYEVAQLSGTALHAAHLLWLATVGSAQTMRMDDKVGNLAPGMEADIVVLDLESTPAIAQRSQRAETLWEAIFPTIMMGDDRAVSAVWVNGFVAHQKDAG